MLTGVHETLVKHTKKRNYYHKRKLFMTIYKLMRGAIMHDKCTCTTCTTINMAFPPLFR